MDPTPLPLNRHNPAPLYYQLARSLELEIETGARRPHDSLPSEAELQAVHGVSRNVVRQALDELERAGAIYRIKGKGAFIQERKLSAYLMQDASGFAANMALQGFVVSSRILRKGIVPAPAPVAEALKVPEGAPVLELERLREVGGEPVFLGTTYVPGALAACVQEEDFTSQSFNAVLARCMGKEPVSGQRIIESVAAGRYEADLLGVRVGSPLFRLFAVTYSQDGEPVECSRVWLRGDRLAFRVDLGPAGSVKGKKA